MPITDGLLEALGKASHVLVLTGSGVSAESGVPTFREAQTGLWENFDPHQLATPEAFLQDPALVWRWYRWRRELVARATPNPGHLALVELAGLVPDLTLVTQNVDGLHQKAGSAPAAKVKTPQPAAKSTPEKQTTVHEVRSGDTLYSISRRYGLTVDQLRTYNNLGKDSAIRPGQKLKLSPP